MQWKGKRVEAERPIRRLLSSDAVLTKEKGVWWFILCVNLAGPQCLDTCLNITLDAYEGVLGWGGHLNQCTFSKANRPPWCAWASSNQPQAWHLPSKSEFCSRWPLNGNIDSSPGSPAYQPTLRILDLLTSITVWANSFKWIFLCTVYVHILVLFLWSQD